MTDQGRNAYRRRYGRWWRQAVGRSNRIIQSIYINLRSQNTSTIDIGQLTTHSRSIISQPVRCIHHTSRATRRNMRDLTILKNAISITDHYRHMFVLYAQHRINHLLSQANAQQQRQSRSVRHRHNIKIRRKHSSRKRKKQKKFKRKHHARFFNKRSNRMNKPTYKDSLKKKIKVVTKSNFFYFDR